MARTILIPLLALMLALVSVAADQCVAPLAWPKRHTHVEYEWNLVNPEEEPQRKFWYYDFTSLNLRVDFNTSGKVTLQSFWINTTLYMYELGTCVELQFPFGMMVPDWMISNASDMGALYVTRRYQRDNGYTLGRWNKKSALPDGYFDYLSDCSSGTALYMHGPSPIGDVVNEYYDFVEVASFPASTFQLPPTKCIVGRSIADVERMPRHANSMRRLRRALRI